MRTMRTNRNAEWKTGIVWLAAFAIWTMLIQRIDVQQAGPQGSRIGFATINRWFHELTGVHMGIYTVTDWLGLVPIAVCLGFAVLGLVQLIQRRSLWKVDGDIILLGVYYMTVIFSYFIFEMIPINYRPILIGGVPEASYPSSTTLLVLSVMPTIRYQLDRRVRSDMVRKMNNVFVWGFSLLMVIGRLIAGVHWFTDIVGAILISRGLFLLYIGSADLIVRRQGDGIR